MKLKSRAYITVGCLVGATAGNTVARMLHLGELQTASYLAPLTPTTIILIFAGVLLGGFIGHVMRHGSEDD